MPVQGIAVGVEAVKVGAQFVSGFFAVLAVAEFEARVPALRELCINEAAYAADVEIAVRLLPERRIKFGFALAFDGAEADLKAVVQVMIEVQTDRFVAIRIVVVIDRVGHRGAVDPRCVFQRTAEVEARVVIAARHPDTVLRTAVAALRTVQAQLRRLIGAAPGENLNHAADRIAAINHRA